MTPERWQQIEKIYDSALEVAENERPAFLETACAGDEALREEVESLVRSEPSGDRFIEEPALKVAARVFAQEKPQSLMGQLIGSGPFSAGDRRDGRSVSCPGFLAACCRLS